MTVLCAVRVRRNELQIKPRAADDAQTIRLMPVHAGFRQNFAAHQDIGTAKASYTIKTKQYGREIVATRKSKLQRGNKLLTLSFLGLEFKDSTACFAIATFKVYAIQVAPLAPSQASSGFIAVSLVCGKLVEHRLSPRPTTCRWA